MAWGGQYDVDAVGGEREFDSSTFMTVPVPRISPSTHSPAYVSPFANVKVPVPCMASSTKPPTYLSPFGSVTEPSPFRMPLRYSHS
jgi:hypothetical protein